MIYYHDENLLIRDMVEADILTITEAELAQGWQVESAKQEMRNRHQQEGRSFALVAEYKGEIAGYINLYRKVIDGPSIYQDFPEIVDVGVLIKFCNKGIGSKLMDVAEELASTMADAVCLGVGLHYGYSSAQRMYVKRGYIPDGSGVWHQGHVLEQYEPCCNDDDLALYMCKALR